MPSPESEFGLKEQFEEEFGVPPHPRWMGKALEHIDMARVHYVKAMRSPGDRQREVLEMVDVLYPHESIKGPIITEDGEQLPTEELHPQLNRSFVRRDLMANPDRALDIGMDILLDALILFGLLARQLPE